MTATKDNVRFHPINALSPLDGRYRDDLEQLVSFFSEATLIRTRTEVEALYIIALSEEGIVRKLKKNELDKLVGLGQGLSEKQVLDIKEIERITKHDVKAVERGMWQFLHGSSMEDLIDYIHFALTSEDINNLSYRLMAQRAKNQILVPLLDSIIDKLVEMADDTKKLVMIAR